jgi:hypothetical protein
MTKWPQLTPKDIGELTPYQAEMLLSGGGQTMTFKNMAEYNQWAQQQKQ